MKNGHISYWKQPIFLSGFHYLQCVSKVINNLFTTPQPGTEILENGNGILRVKAGKGNLDR